MCDYIFVIKFRWPLAVRSSANRMIRVRQIASPHYFYIDSHTYYTIYIINYKGLYLFYFCVDWHEICV